VSLRPVDPMGSRRGLRPLQPGHGAALGPREPAARAHLEPRRIAAVQAHRELLQLPGASRLQAEVRSRLGAALPGVAGRARAAQDPHERLGACVAWIARRDLEMTPVRRFSAAASTRWRAPRTAPPAGWSTWSGRPPAP